MSCCSIVFTATKRMLGRLIASQIASASLASFLLLFTYGFTNCGAINFTAIPCAWNARAPVVRATTSLHADHAARFNRFQQYLEPVRSRQLPAQRHLLIPVDPVYLEDRLCQIYANAHKLHGGPFLSVDWSITLPVWHVDAVRVRRGPSHCYRPCPDGQCAPKRSSNIMRAA